MKRSRRSPHTRQKGSLQTAKKSRMFGFPWQALALLVLLVGVGIVFGAAAKRRSLVLASNPLPVSTPQYAANAPAKEYVYAGSKLIAVSEPENPPPADLALWRPPGGIDGTCCGNWTVLGGQGSQQVTQGWGLQGDIPAPGDFDGDGKTDFSIFRPSDSKWYLLMSGDNSINVLQWGDSGDLPAQADFDGDGKTDRAIYRPNGGASTGYARWWVFQSSDGSFYTPEWGTSTDIPAPADYDGDGKADATVWRNSNTNFYSWFSSDSSQQTLDFGSTIAGTPVSADYDGDGRADFAVFKPGVSGVSYASWNVLYSSNGSMGMLLEWGIEGDKPVQNDYDGDGKCDPAIWRPSDGYWWIAQSASSYSTRLQQFGQNGDVPVPAFYRR